MKMQEFMVNKFGLVLKLLRVVMQEFRLHDALFKIEHHVVWNVLFWMVGSQIPVFSSSFPTHTY